MYSNNQRRCNRELARGPLLHALQWHGTMMQSVTRLAEANRGERLMARTIIADAAKTAATM